MGRSGIVTIMCCCIIIIYSYSDNGCSCRRESGRCEGWKMGSPSGYGAKVAHWRWATHHSSNGIQIYGRQVLKLLPDH